MSHNEDAAYFAFSATLRIHGTDIGVDDITQALALTPTYCHRSGQLRSKTIGKSESSSARRFYDDAWHYSPDLPDEAPLDMHLQLLWSDIAPSESYLVDLKSKHQIDVFCGYRSNCDQSGFQLSPKSFAIFTTLDISCEMSVIIA